MMKLKLDSVELRNLILLLIIPFIIIVILIYPLSNGVQGTTHSEAGNDFEFKRLATTEDLIDKENVTEPDNPYRGHFKGDLYVDFNTGWIFCNGKVRYAGKLHIKNAELDYKIKEEDYSHQFSAFDYQNIEINGEKGEMEEGVPFYFLGFIGSMLGFLYWLFRYSTKNSTIYDSLIVQFSILLGFFSTIIIGFQRICFVICLVMIPLVIVLFTKWELMKKNQNYRLGTAYFALGIPLIVISLLSLIFPMHSTIDGTYDTSVSIGSIMFGILGLMASVGLVALGLAKNPYEIPHRKV